MLLRVSLFCFLRFGFNEPFPAAASAAFLFAILLIVYGKLKGLMASVVIYTVEIARLKLKCEPYATWIDTTRSWKDSYSRHHEYRKCW
jgi:hypothetical protein